MSDFHTALVRAIGGEPIAASNQDEELHRAVAESDLGKGAAFFVALPKERRA